MPKGMPNKKYTAEFKKIVVETLLEEKMSYSEAERQVGVVRSRMTAWERIYLTDRRACRLFFTDHKPFHPLERFYLRNIA